MVQAIAFANWKGGVGKTTSVANVGAALAERGRRVLLVDLDPQANLTEGFGLLEEPAHTVGELLEGRDGVAPESSVRSLGPGLDLLASSAELGDLAWSLVEDPDYRERLPAILRALGDHYDFALLDTPPGLGLWPGLALLAADAVVVPTRPHDLDVMATGKLYDYIEAEIRPRNPGLRVVGALVTQGGSRWRLLRDTRRRLRLDEINALETEIPASVKVAAAPRAGKPTLWLEPDGKVAYAYRRATDEVLVSIEAIAA
ncbi:MAG: ParA family protein [Actinomycetota bacterium]|nr:ParA family protein [Actinomycetota bacterium]